MVLPGIPCNRCGFCTLVRLTYNIRDTELYIAMCVCGDAQDTNTVTSPVTSGDITDVSSKR